MLAGDAAAFEDFFQGNFPRLYRFALTRMNHDVDAAEEVVQTALCAAISKIGTYRGEAALFTWLCTFCRHEIHAYYERVRKAPPMTELVEQHPEISAALESLWALTGANPEDLLGRSEVARLVHVALDRLPGRYGDALEWKYVEGLTVGEIAGRLGLSAKAAESVLSRARVAFRDAFLTLTRQGLPEGEVP
jgi:RNA polymerase sigma-70 factor (ECF subfamily)